MSTRQDMFKGYLRKDDNAGIRNYVGVIPTVNCCNEIAVNIAKQFDNVIALPHIGRCVFLGKDQDRLFNILTNIGKNPNLGGVIVVGTGCEPNSAEKMTQEISLSKKPVDFVTIKKSGNYNKTIKDGIRMAKYQSEKISLYKRTLLPLKYITLAIKCGGSDATSGIASNIVSGMIADHIIECGGKVLFTETPELIGAEKIIAKRAKNEKIRKKLILAINRQEKRMINMGVDIRNCEPNPGNIQGGLTTIEEKSLGAIAKSGKKPLVDVLESGERPLSRGLYFIDGPSNTTEIFSNVSAAGAQILLFSIGGGIPACLPVAPGHSGIFPLMPIVKMTGNPYKKKSIDLNMDLDVSSILTGDENYHDSFKKSIEYLIKVFSGDITPKGYQNKTYFEPMNIYFEGPLI